jgi:hypothetical protein
MKSCFLMYKFVYILFLSSILLNNFQFICDIDLHLISHILATSNWPKYVFSIYESGRIILCHQDFYQKLHFEVSMI